MRFFEARYLRIAGLLQEGRLSIHEIVRRCHSDHRSVRRIAAELGLNDASAPAYRRKKIPRCPGCGCLLTTGECFICLQNLREEIARRRREVQRELRENPVQILKIFAEHQRRRALPIPGNFRAKSPPRAKLLPDASAQNQNSRTGNISMAKAKPVALKHVTEAQIKTAAVSKRRLGLSGTIQEIVQDLEAFAAAHPEMEAAVVALLEKWLGVA
jgi:hypothetical protein